MNQGALFVPTFGGERPVTPSSGARDERHPPASNETGAAGSFPDPDSVRAADLRTEQRRQLRRVSGRIAEAIVAWCRSRVGLDFVLSAFTADVMADTQCAPDSPRRVLQELHTDGRLKVECIDRSRSRWRVLYVEAAR